MNNIAQFRAYVNKFGYFSKGRLMIEWKGTEYPVSGIWHLIELGLFK